MAQMSEWEAYFAGLRHLRAHRDQGDVWRVKGPRLIWSARAEQERLGIIRTLVSTWGFPALWCDDESANAPRWSFPEVSGLERIIESLYEGEWVLLFFPRNPGPQLPDLVTPGRPGVVREFVSAVKAGAAIWSEVDDAEWVVVINDAM